MFLASCIRTDYDALQCDLAETYHIYDIKVLPLSKVALFSVGLRNDSRIKMKISGVNYDIQEILLASISDRLAYIYASLCGADNPKLILDEMLGIKTQKDYMVFDSFDEFRKKRNEILGGISDGK